ncbi:hypothetical protein Xszus_01088 [Xenorhabdus szentirmaii]|uniref:Uncharacterized protein n=1 Tax=Xenorhabdus szentirmaii DSM 16338 TaxID=1427518 RepID=W1ITK3_9GAMM|nr:hypothetical protein Xsze_03036 [Xenorhabdus szentirmaii DSM 16338]PHM41401.1 hypothetical protein Xszus_01088 [Xenorhabdus szentirmaii]CDL80921.1 conserved hypothetical protein [Xenorhabdus szentirmaii DSM 16338]
MISVYGIFCLRYSIVCQSVACSFYNLGIITECDSFHALHSNRTKLRNIPRLTKNQTQANLLSVSYTAW